MPKNSEDGRSRRRLILRQVAEKLALGGICLVLSATAAVAKQSDAPGERAKEPGSAITDRIDAVRSRLGADGTAENRFILNLQKVAQWYNWPNWRNGWNNWRNSRWFNYR